MFVFSIDSGATFHNLMFARSSGSRFEQLSRFGPRNEIAAMQFIVAALELAEQQSSSIGSLQSASVASELPSDSFAAVALRYRRTEQSTLRAVADSFRRTTESMQQ